MRYNSFFEIMNSMALRQEMEIRTIDDSLFDCIIKTISVTDDVNKFLITYIDRFDKVHQTYIMAK